MNIERFCILIIYAYMKRIMMTITRISHPKTYHQTGNRRQKKGKAGRSKPKTQRKDWSMVWTTVTDTCMFTNLQQQYIWWWPATVPSPLRERERNLFTYICMQRLVHKWFTTDLRFLSCFRLWKGIQGLLSLQVNIFAEPQTTDWNRVKLCREGHTATKSKTLRMEHTRITPSSTNKVTWNTSTCWIQVKSAQHNCQFARHPV